MKKTRNFQSLLGKILVPAIALFAFTQCSDDSELKNEAAEAATEVATTAASTDEDPILSLTIDGTHTKLSSRVNCKTCAYVVPANATVVDGKALGIKPGQAICLDEAVKYGNLKLINLEGTEDKPIIVAYGMKDLDLLADGNKTEDYSQR